jgi:hypothetical protein
MRGSAARLSGRGHRFLYIVFAAIAFWLDRQRDPA